ncbi:MAG: hypothetical protein RL662_460 [Bacteroidota bacterium]|jgi:hypothetical protein
MLVLDSLLATYTTRPAYYVRFGNHGCLFDLRINDVYTEKMTYPGRIGSTIEPINTEILRSGTNKVSLRIYPFPGEQVITEQKPFHLEIIYKDFALPAGKRPWHSVLQMPAITVPAEGLPYYEYEAEFEAEVPYQVTGWSDCIDLRKVPNIEQKLVTEFKRIRQLMVDHKFEDLRKMLETKHYDIGVPLYQSSAYREELWEEYIADIKEAEADEWQPIEDYELVFYADGRLVTLESKKKKGFPSAIVWIKSGGGRYRYCYFDMRLGIRKGTDKFVPIR